MKMISFLGMVRSLNITIDIKEVGVVDFFFLNAYIIFILSYSFLDNQGRFCKVISLFYQAIYLSSLYILFFNIHTNVR